jgi:hypothetical protein
VCHTAGQDEGPDPKHKFKEIKENKQSAILSDSVIMSEHCPSKFELRCKKENKKS